MEEFKNEKINGIAHVPVNKRIIQKSVPLLSALKKSSLTVTDLKILDIYLSRINSHEPNKTVVTFEKGELEEVLGVSRLRKKALDARLKHLMTSIRIEDLNNPDNFIRMCIFEHAVCKKDKNTDLWDIELKCTQTAAKYIFNIEEQRYLPYALKNIINLDSLYSYWMFLYLEENGRRNVWKVDIDNLREHLCCANEPTYQSYKRFNDLILKKVHKEIQEKTKYKYDYNPIKKGRKIIAIEFVIHPNKVVEAEYTDVRPPKNSMKEEKNINQNNEQVINMGYVSGTIEAIQNFNVEVFEGLFNVTECEDIITTISYKLGDYTSYEDLKMYAIKVFKKLKVAINEYGVAKPYNYFKTMIDKDVISTPAPTQDLPNWYAEEGHPASEEDLAEAYRVQQKLKEEKEYSTYDIASDDLPF